MKRSFKSYEKHIQRKLSKGATREIEDKPRPAKAYYLPRLFRERNCFLLLCNPILNYVTFGGKKGAQEIKLGLSLLVAE